MANTLRWSEEQLDAHLRRAPEVEPQSPAAKRLPVAVGVVSPPELNPAMNKTEAEYAGMLEERRLRGEVAWWRYEAITLKLADNTRYTPDFLVLLPDGVLEIHETKGGFIREDGWLKLKVAAALFPFRFFLCQKASKKNGGGWSIKGV